MSQSVPPVAAFYWPVLSVLRGHEDPAQRRAIVQEAAIELGLTPDELTTPGPGAGTMAEYRAGWALSHLRALGLVEKVERGLWRLLPAGRELDETEVHDLGRQLTRKYRQSTEIVGIDESGTAQVWLVGATIGGVDLTEKFVQEGLWQINTPSTIDLGHLNTMRPGDLIAIKASFTQKHGLPFENHGRTVSAMRIKARGTITRVADDQIFVDWEQLAPSRDWYFYTGRSTIWRLPQHPMAEQLEAFIFEDAPQNYDEFLEDPHWHTVYSDPSPLLDDPPAEGYDWIPFYEGMADALAERLDDRDWLASAFVDIRRRNQLAAWTDKYADGTSGPLADMEPITYMSLFNLGQIPQEKRVRMAREAAEALGLDLMPPEDFTGIPVTHPQQGWLFGWAHERGDDIDQIWAAFLAGLAWADHPDNLEARATFATAFAQAVDATNWQLATGLYRARPRFFCPMDGNTRTLIHQHLGLLAPDPHAVSAGSFYMELLDTLRDYLMREGAPARTIAEFSALAFNSRTNAELVGSAHLAPLLDEVSVAVEEATSYTLEDLVAEGCFVPRHELERILSSLDRTKNLILQGAPGTGKTWLARRLGWVLAGRKTASDVAVVQFHPNTSYEDFVRGYRPWTSESGQAGLRLVDGPLLRLAERAHGAPSRQFTMVIEEINRGNPARALGEMLTLIEASKRTEADAIRLTYERPELEPNGMWLPPNLYMVGTMNIADRSLALVDLALRRRFSFVTLEPQFGPAWKEWLVARLDAPNAAAIADALAAGIAELNGHIRQDLTLGPNFVIGHSFFTPSETVNDPREWFDEQVEGSIRPLLHEYWFDDRARAVTLSDELLEFWP